MSSAAHDDPLHDTRLAHQVLELVRNWMRRTGEASAAHTEAAIDRGSFESFPASDPVAPATSSTDRTPSLEEVDCTMSPGELVFRCGAREPDASRPPPAYSIEGDLPGGGRLRLRVWVDDASPQESVPSALALEAVHASLRPRQHERRTSGERRMQSRSMPAGFDRRLAERRGALPDPERAAA